MSKTISMVLLAALTGCAANGSDPVDVPISVAVAADDVTPATNHPSPCWVTLNSCSGDIIRGMGHDCSCTNGCSGTTCQSSCNSLYARTCGAN